VRGSRPETLSAFGRAAVTDPSRVVGSGAELQAATLGGSSVRSEVSGKVSSKSIERDPSKVRIFAPFDDTREERSGLGGEERRRARSEGLGEAPVKQDERYSKEKNAKREKNWDAK
jgi:hypothetical protein